MVNLSEMLVKYVKDHPEKSNQETRLLMLGALVEAFPCAPSNLPKKQDKVPDTAAIYLVPRPQTNMATLCCTV
jgi:hypothetical protein